MDEEDNKMGNTPSFGVEKVRRNRTIPRLCVFVINTNF